MNPRVEPPIFPAPQEPGRTPGRALGSPALRRLALEYARGRLPEHLYRARRAELIDAIVDGEYDIATDPEPSEPTESPAAMAEKDSPELPEARRLPARYLVLGLVVVFALGGTIWMLAPRGKPEAPQAIPAPAPPAAKHMSPAHALAKAFMTAKDFSAASTHRFHESWQALPPEARKSAQGTDWFADLVDEVEEQIRAQSALVGLGTNAQGRSELAALLSLGHSLGVSASALPSAPTSAPRATPAPAATAEAGAGEAATAPAPAEAPNETAQRAPAAEATVKPTPTARAPKIASAAPARPAPPTAAHGAPSRVRARGWLERQPAHHFTVQLFALDKIAGVERWTRRHPELRLEVLDNTRVHPRYRVLYGSYATEAEARAAYARLPADVRRAQPHAYVRSFAALRAFLSRAPAATTHRAGRWLTNQPADHLSLQIFVSSSEQGARDFVHRYPGLRLHVHRAGSRSLYRVLYGSFASQAQARRAFLRLPRSIRQVARRPILKTFARLRAENAASGPGG